MSLKTKYFGIFFLIAIFLVTVYFFVSTNKKPETKTSYKGQNCRLSQESDCYGNDKKCELAKRYVYDEYGLKAVYNTHKANLLRKFMKGRGYNSIDLYDKNGNKIMEKTDCDDNLENCLGSNKYDYDKNNNLIKEYRFCKRDSSDCAEIIRYSYDNKNNKTAEFFERKNLNANHGEANKYIYDSLNRNTKSYLLCDYNFENCQQTNINNYDSENHLVVTYLCDKNFENCNFRHEYKYDTHGNLVAKAEYCSKDQKDCSFYHMYDYKYDDNDRLIERKFFWGVKDMKITKYIYECD